jgi:ABC-type transport system involved in multi-copper enzyme maturation permease subunit
MQIPPLLLPIIRVARVTLSDEVRQKSFIVICAICAVFVFMSRGCYQGNYMVNGQLLNAGTLAGTVSKVTFHIIAAGVMLMAALLAMRAFRRDRDQGMQACILSKPITRWQYVLGKVLGLWVLAALLMFILHGIVLFITFIHVKVLIAGYFAASLLCALNLLFVVVAVLLLSLLMPDIIAFMGVLSIGIISLAADAIYAIHKSQIVQTLIQNQSHTDLTFSKVVYFVWPKLSGTQQAAAALINHTGFYGFESVYPVMNVLSYCLILVALLLWRFRNTEVI